MKYDYLIVGSGLTGATIARLLTDAGKSCIVVERRNHLGGNVHDQVHASGIRFHTYGPHYFRTNSDRIWKFAKRFGDFYKYEARVMSLVDGRLEHWPIQEECVTRLCGAKWRGEVSSFKLQVKKPGNFEETCLTMMPRLIYEKFVRGYTEKQWGVPAASLDAGLAKRFDVRTDGDTRLSRHKWQGIPLRGYHAWMMEMLNGVECETNAEIGGVPKGKYKHAVWTGPIDSLFGCDEGALQYRGQKRINIATPTPNGCAQINFPSRDGAIRHISWPDIAPYQLVCSTGLTTLETPFTPCATTDFEYPFPDAANAKLCASYRKRADKVKGLTVCGRLGEYRYLDMDQAIARAMMIAGKLLRS